MRLLKKGRILGGAFFVFSLIVIANVCYQAHEYTLMQRNDQKSIQKKWCNQISQFEKYSEFMASSLQRGAETHKLTSLRAISAHAPHDISYFESVLPTSSKQAAPSGYLRIQKRIKDKNLTYVIDVPLGELKTVLGVKSLLQDSRGTLKSAWGHYAYVSTYPHFWRTFYENCAHVIVVEFILCIILYVGFIFISLGAAFSQRHYQSAQVRALKKALLEEGRSLKRTTHELSLLNEKVSLFRQKESMEKDLSVYISKSRKKQIEKVMALSILLNHEDVQNSFAEELIISAKQLAAGEIEIGVPRQLNLLNLLKNVKDALALDLLNAQVDLILDASIEDTFLLADEEATRLFFVCYLKKVIMSCFGTSSLSIRKKCNKSISICIQGKYIDSSLTFLNDDIQLGHLQITQDNLDRLQYNLSFLLDKKDNEHIIVFQNCLAHENNEDSSCDNIVPLFA